MTKIGLIWKWDNEPIVRGDSVHACEARAGRGAYRIIPVFKIDRSEVSHYSAEYYANRKMPEEERRTIGLFPTMEAAMAAAQRDCDEK